MKINVVGLGYIGLPTALTMANAGFTVVGTDYNKGLVETLNAGKVTFEEKGLVELFNSAVSTGNISFSNDYQEAEVYIVSVPTPYDKFSKKIDASYVINAVKEVLNVCKDESIIVIESTISPGTIEKYIKPLVNKNV